MMYNPQLIPLHLCGSIKAVSARQRTNCIFPTGGDQADQFVENNLEYSFLPEPTEVLW